MGRASFLVTLFIFSICVSAQDDGCLYLKKTAVIERIANNLAEEQANDSMPAASFREAILESFENYWKNKNAKSKLSLPELETKQTEWASLQAEVAALLDSVAKLKQLEKDVKLNQMELQLKKAENDVLEADSLLKSKKDELLSNLTVLQQQQQILEKFNQSGSNLQAIASSVEESVQEAYKQLTSGSLIGIDLTLFKQVVVNFEDNQTDIKELMDAAQYEAMEGKKAHIKTFLPLCETISNAVEQMGNKKFDEKANEKLRTAIKLSKINLSKSQKEECDSIIFALEHQNNAYNNFIFILNLAKKSEDLPINIAKLIDDLHSFLDEGLTESVNGRTYYNKYYKLFNLQLDSLRKEVPNITTKDKLEKYLNEVNNKL